VKFAGRLLRIIDCCVIAIAPRRIYACLGLALALAALGSVFTACASVVEVDQVADPAVAKALTLNDNLKSLLDASAGIQAGVQVALIESQRHRLAEIIRSFGYLSGDARIEASGAVGDLRLHIFPILGPRYRLGLIEVEGLEGLGASDATKVAIRQFVLQFPGNAADARTLYGVENEILRRLRESSYPTARIVNRELIPDAQNRVATLKIRMSIAGPGEFGQVIFSGANGTNVSGLEVLKPFTIGERYDARLLSEYRRKLEATGFFDLVMVEPARETDLAGRIPIQVSVTPRRPDPQKLAQSGRDGFIVTATTLVALALRQGFAIVGARRGPLRRIDTVVGALLITSAMFIVLRFVSLLGVD
jgi:translocation and assembly module TamA